MELSDLPGELADRGIWWQIGGFAVVSAASVALLVEFDGSDTRAYRYFETAVRTMYWANVFVLFGLFEGVRKVFERASDIRKRYAERRARDREQAIRKAEERAEKRGLERGEKRGLERGEKRGEKRGLERGLQQQRARRREAYARFGMEIDGVTVLPDTPEVQAFLDGDE